MMMQHKRYQSMIPTLGIGHNNFSWLTDATRSTEAKQPPLTLPFLGVPLFQNFEFPARGMERGMCKLSISIFCSIIWYLNLNNCSLRLLPVTNVLRKAT